jgi:hypothetical protein
MVPQSAFNVAPLGKSINVTHTIDIKLTGNQNNIGFIGPLTLVSQITNGTPAVRIHVDDGRHLANAQPNKWKSIGGGAAMRRALIYAKGQTDGRRAARGSQSVVLEGDYGRGVEAAGLQP